MLQRSIELVLFIATVIGAVLVFQSSSLRNKLTRDHQRLKLKTGSLTITDPTLVHIRAIDTGEPLNFAWRVYVPPNFDLAYRCSSGGGSGSNNVAWEGIFRVRLKEVGGDYHLYHRFAGGSGRRSLGSPELKQFFDKHPGYLDKLIVEQLGASEIVTFDPMEVKTLIKISLPDDMLQEAKSELSKWEYQRIEKQVEWMRIGSRNAINQDPVKLN